MADLRIQRLEKTFKDGHTAVAGISFDLADREAVFLLGRSGAGKTTTLRLVAGLEDASAGRIRIGSRDETDLTPRVRNVATVYDKQSLFPHLSIFEKLAYPLRIRKMPDAAMKARIAEVAAVLQIERLMPYEQNAGLTDAGYDIDDFLPRVISGIGAFNDTLYTIPLGAGPVGTTFRADLAQQAGFKLPERVSPDFTTDCMFEAAQKFHNP